ncbi:unnamed protein product [Rhizophagus irregularis]|nr:unnamed protein product [Rhizophagus irregularis]CAB4419552.1 unnamed protein product [Rhizophagus irregularis]
MLSILSTNHFALLHISLSTLSFITDYHKELINSSVVQATNLLAILVFCFKLDYYTNNFLVGWIQIQNLLSTLYVSEIKMAFKTDKPFLNINIIFENWYGYQVKFQIIGNKATIYRFFYILKINKSEFSIHTYNDFFHHYIVKLLKY